MRVLTNNPGVVLKIKLIAAPFVLDPTLTAGTRPSQLAVALEAPSAVVAQLTQVEAPHPDRRHTRPQKVVVLAS